MFGAKKAHITCEQEAADVYAVLLARALEPVFFKDLEVPDTFEGRFDLLLLHVFAVMHVALGDARGEGFNQALFDVMFMDMDQSLREAGKGDMGVPKQMRYMMKAFNGRMNRYEEAVRNKKMFKEAVQLNVYGEQPVKAKSVKALSDYILENIEHLKKKHAKTMFKGKITLKAIKI